MFVCLRYRSTSSSDHSSDADSHMNFMKSSKSSPTKLTNIYEKADENSSTSNSMSPQKQNNKKMFQIITPISFGEHDGDSSINLFFFVKCFVLNYFTFHFLSNLLRQNPTKRGPHHLYLFEQSNSFSNLELLIHSADKKAFLLTHAILEKQT